MFYAVEKCFLTSGFFSLFFFFSLLPNCFFLICAWLFPQAGVQRCSVLLKAKCQRMVLLEMQKYYCVTTALHFVIRFALAGIWSMLPFGFFSASVLVRRCAAQVVFSGRPGRSIPLKLERSSMLKDAITVCATITRPFSVMDRCDDFEVTFTGASPHSMKSNCLRVAIFFC